ncbi:MAG: ABC transporter permease [Coriobacteriia bacterium]|nr:ABC transporter permease [Coriobacteriia bacterium]
MRNTIALTRRILQQFSHDPRTIALFIFVPIFALGLLSVMLNSPAYQPKLVAVDLPADVVAALAEQEATVIVASAAQAEQLLAAKEIDAVITLDGTTLTIEVEGSDPTKTGAVMQVVQSAVKDLTLTQREQMLSDIEERFSTIKSLLSSLPSGLPGVPDLPDLDDIITQFTPTVDKIDLLYLHGNSEWGNFDFFGPVIIGVFIFIFVFITSGMSLVTERTGGTMERLLVTPIKAWQLVLGFCIGFGLVSLIQAAIVLWACITLIGFPNEGSLILVICVTFSMAMVSMNLGLLVSALARTPFQVIQFMLVLVIPQVLLSGVFDLNGAPAWMQVLSRCFPVTHGAEALRAIMLGGAGLQAIGANLVALWGFVLAFFALASLSFARRKSS